MPARSTSTATTPPPRPWRQPGPARPGFRSLLTSTLYPGVERFWIDRLPIVSRDFPARLMEEPDSKLPSAGCTALPPTSPPQLSAKEAFSPGTAIASSLRRLSRARRRHHRRGRHLPRRIYLWIGEELGLTGWPLPRQLDFACAAAALNCMGVGARGGIQSVEAIEPLIATNFRHRSTFNVKDPTSNVRSPAKNEKNAPNLKNSAVYVIAND